MFRSVLFGEFEPGADIDSRSEPECFRDLNLDQIISAVVGRKESYNLKPFFYTPLTDVDTLIYRHQIFQDLERPEIHKLAAGFAQKELVRRFESQVRSMRRDDEGFAHHHRTRAFLNATHEYCTTVTDLAEGLTATDAQSRGLRDLRDHLDSYAASDGFIALQADIRRLEDGLDGVRYSFLIKDSTITVGAYDDETDYSAQVTATFERFQQGAAKNYMPDFSDWEEYVAIGVLHLVAKVYPELFAELDDFCRRHAAYLDRTVAVFDRELQFYLSYLDYIGPLREAGLAFSYPRISTANKIEEIRETFDLALATQLISQAAPMVCNDIHLAGVERILVVSGPNNGGKTTLARTFGQLHYLARLGVPVPGRDAQLFLCDEIFTHFERQEDITTLEGKLQDELNRLHDVLGRATSDSVLILNEMFNSTTAQDALALSRAILGAVSAWDALCVCVTFLDELAALNEKTVSMVSTVRTDDPAVRTYKLIRKPADGRAYAHAIAEKYGLTYDRLVGRRTG
ncbi:MAG TPA: hypothetical protein VMD48_08470 [Solirubrobacteraceae bacterium]|nr:hypothetical protein [Solirubrobacteraceae bacterium]